MEHRADESSGEIRLLIRAQPVWDIWSVEVIGPRLFLRVGHFLDRGIELQRGFRGREEASEFDGREVAGVIITQIKNGDAVGDR